MNSHSWITLLACVGELLLLALVLFRGRRTPFSGPLLALSIVVFAWNFCGLAWQVSGNEEWRWLDISFSPFTSTLALQFVLAFTGRRRQLRALSVGAYVFSALIALIGPLALLVPETKRLYDGGPLPLIHLCGLVVIMLIAVALLIHHLRSSHDPAERMRTRLLIVALSVATSLGTTELLSDLGLDVPRLGALGILIGNALVVMVALRLHLFDRQLTVLDLTYAVVLAVLGVSAYLIVLQLLGTRTALIVVASVSVTLLLLAGVRQMTLGFRADRAQLEQLAYLGRLSAQLAHDLKNPLAALRGAAQFLEVELQQGRPLTEHRQFLSLIVEQADRMQRVVSDYNRLGRMELAREPVDPNALVRDVLALQTFAASSAIALKSQLAAEVPRCALDRDLVTNALENLLHNAFQAMPSGGEVCVSTRASNEGDTPFLVLSVSDTGPGMDARTRERAFEDFFTTRAEGTGLGLGFVRRVADAHGGRAVLKTREQQGTRVELWFPIPPPQTGTPWTR